MSTFRNIIIIINICHFGIEHTIVVDEALNTILNMLSRCII